MDRTIDVRTPESIAFSYELAGLGSRFLALAVDQAIQLATLLAIFAGIILAGTRVTGRQTQAVMSEKAAESVAIAIIVVIVFAVLFGYFIVSRRCGTGRLPARSCSEFASCATAATRSTSARR